MAPPVWLSLVRRSQGLIQLAGGPRPCPRMLRMLL